jgi:hypothetical protein
MGTLRYDSGSEGENARDGRLTGEADAALPGVPSNVAGVSGGTAIVNLDKYPD